MLTITWELQRIINSGYVHKSRQRKQRTFPENIKCQVLKPDRMYTIISQ